MHNRGGGEGATLGVNDLTRFLTRESHNPTFSTISTDSFAVYLYTYIHIHYLNITLTQPLDRFTSWLFITWPNRETAKVILYCCVHTLIQEALSNTKQGTPGYRHIHYNFIRIRGLRWWIIIYTWCKSCLFGHYSEERQKNLWLVEQLNHTIWNRASLDL